MRGSWDFGQEPNVAAEGEEPPSCGGSQETAEARGESAPGPGKGAQQVTGWARLASTSGGLLAHPQAWAVSCCAVLWDVTLNYIVPSYAMRIIHFPFCSSLSSERGMT